MSTLKDRLMSKTFVCDDGCWYCEAGGDSAPYGKIYYEGRTIDNHIASWIVHKGPIPEGKSILHSCDYKRCINPEHLFAGTQQDNIDDMIAKGRKAPAHPQAKLTKEQVIQIKNALITEEYTQTELAKLYGVSFYTIYNIRVGRTWANV